MNVLLGTWAEVVLCALCDGALGFEFGLNGTFVHRFLLVVPLFTASCL